MSLGNLQGQLHIMFNEKVVVTFFSFFFKKKILLSLSFASTFYQGTSFIQSLIYSLSCGTATQCSAQRTSAYYPEISLVASVWEQSRTIQCERRAEQ